MKLENIFSIKKAAESDAPLIQSIADRVWVETFSGMIPDGQVEFMYQQQYTVPSLLTQMQEGEIFFLIYEDNGAIGFSSLSWDDMEKGVMKLNKFYLVPECHGTGCALYFLNYLKEHVVKEYKGSHIILNVNRGNGRAISFYQKMKFEIIESVDIQLNQYMLNDYIMSLDLAMQVQ